jgi:hypothetical protein
MSTLLLELEAVGSELLELESAELSEPLAPSVLLDDFEPDCALETAD